VGAIWVVSTRAPTQPGGRTRSGDDQRHRAVLGVVTAVLGDLRRLPGADGPLLGHAGEVGRVRVPARAP
jgi:hypothetical protein